MFLSSIQSFHCWFCRALLLYSFSNTTQGPSWLWSYGSSIYNYLCNQCLLPLKLQGLLDPTLCDKVCQWLATGQWFSQGSPVSSTNKTGHHDITEILLKVALNTINQTTPNQYNTCWTLDPQDSEPIDSGAFIYTRLNLNLNQRLLKSLYRLPGYKKNQLVLCKNMSCSGSHLGIPININNTKFVKDLPMIDAQFRFNQCNSFREEHISVFSPYGPVLIVWPVVATILDFRSA